MKIIQKGKGQSMELSREYLTLNPRNRKFSDDLLKDIMMKLNGYVR